MKHIKPYTIYKKIFESNSEIINTVKDLLLDLQDDGINIRWIFRPQSIELSSIEDKEIDLSKYKDQLESTLEFLKSEGYNFKSFIG
jgi:hypothetical protein